MMMKPLIATASLACLFSLALPAQPPAPDFSVTDSQGQTHQLYSGYLNQGKTVVLKLFFTYCPPCNAIAPLVEPLYQAWGGGSGDVEFISLTTKNDDTSADVAAYKANHGHTFPGAGADGGSLAANLPYRDGTYGLFLGTPTFVVIAPDGTVTFDPRGPNQQATINALDAAIAATGAVRPLVSFTAGGSINTPGGAPVSGALVELLELLGYSGSSNAAGQYSFIAQLDPAQQYTLIASRGGDHRNGISTHDLLLMSRHILGIATFDDPLLLIASDANRDKRVTTLDLIFLRRLILGIDTEFSNQQAWIFINPAYQFQDPASPFNETYEGNAGKIVFSPGSSAPLNWIGVKVGDVNGSADGSEGGRE